MATLPLLMQIANAIGASTLSPRLRLTLLAFAYLANHATGKGYTGQEKIALWIGCKERQLRDNLTEIDKLVKDGKCPVAIRRTARMRSDGRGRSSDVYQLELVPNCGQLPLPEEASKPATPSTNQPEEDFPLVNRPTGAPLPLTDNDQPALHCRLLTTTNRQCSDDQPAVQGTTNRRSTAGDHGSDHGSSDHGSYSDRLSPSRGVPASGSFVLVPEAPPKAPKASQAKAKATDGATSSPGVHDLKLWYVEQYEQHRRTKPDFGPRWSRAMKAFSELVATHGLDTAKTVVARALSDAWVRRVEPWCIAEDANRYLGEPLTPSRRTPVIRQSGHNPAIEVDDTKWGPAGALDAASLARTGTIQ